VEEQARDAIVRAKRLQDLQIEWKERLSQAHASALVLRLADSLFVSPLITIPEAQRISGVKQYHTARKSIEKLVSVGILKQVGESSYGKTFIAEEILQTIGEGTKQ
jgi:Fic family protein